ncbi:hypothetical protein [Aquihabitans sp. McL0605]|uniref:hypothetical protein n=1 Tax=Aquihabitans sp. McL0605 TaxID=3415671 RepID=UPI003CE75BE6
MLGFSESSEYRRRQAHNTDAAVAYLDLLDRAPTAEETLDWVTREEAGTTDAALLDELVRRAAYGS